MSSSTPASPRGSGLSLYANLLGPSTTTTPASVTRGPVVFKTPSEEESSAKKPQIDASALRFQPTKRPQISQKPKPKASFPKAIPSESKPANDAPAVAPNTIRPATKSTLADWAAVGDDDDVNGFYGREMRQRGGRKRRKKNREEHVVVQDWDDIYDPARPNSYEEYRNSDEKIREVREWKDRLYAHRMARKAVSDNDSDEEDSYRPQMDQFAPPSSYSFAPPPADSPPPRPPPGENGEDDSYSPKLSPASPPPPPPAEEPPLPPQPPANMSAPPLSAPAISRAPVRYNLPAAPTEIPASEAELEKALAAEPEGEDQGAETKEGAERSLRPGQKGFAERLMSKYGWTKGSGLGANESGIVNPLRVQVEKRKKKSDAEGGGFREPPGGRGKIIGGQKKVEEPDVGKFGAMSEVIVLRGMVDGMNLEEEVEGDGGLMQEIGDECAEKYGRVERVYINRHGTGPAKVLVKFTSQLSGLRAVNALEGRIFNGNTISALFFDSGKFEKGIYE